MRPDKGVIGTRLDRPLVPAFLFSQSSDAGKRWETPANSRSLSTGALRRRIRLSDFPKQSEEHSSRSSR